MQRIITTALRLLATPAIAELRTPCLCDPIEQLLFRVCFSGVCRKSPVQPLDPQAALAMMNGLRAANGVKPLALDVRLSAL